jgi:hypothetical protein
MRILVITDSLGLARETPECVDFYETWPELLKQNQEVHCLRIGGATLKMLAGQLAYYKSLKPEILIFQSGIVDAAPRALTDLENQLINKFYITREITRKLLTDSRLKKLRKRRHLVLTPLNHFRNLMKSIKNQFSQTTIFWIEILPVSDSYELLIPNIRRNVFEYNRLIHHEFEGKVIELKDIPLAGIMSDGMHLSKEGHLFLYKRIIQLLTRISPNV